jgi:hypothetical protein
VIREELVSLIDKLKQFGASEERINKMIEKALVYMDEVLTELTAQKKLKITWPNKRPAAFFH